MEFASFQFCVIMCGVQQPARSEYAPLLEKNRILRSFILFRWYKNLNIAIPKTKDDPVLPLQSRGRHGAWWELSHVFFTLLTSVVGAGMLSIPYTFTLITRWEALISLLVVGCSMGLMSIAILHANATLVANDTFTQNGSPNKYLSFHSIAVEAGGPLFGYIVSISIAIAIYGGCVGCIRIIRDIVPFVVSIILDPSNAAVETTLSESLLWFTFVLVVFPLCMLKSLSGLRFSSYVGFSFSVYLTLSMLYRSFSSEKSEKAIQSRPITLSNYTQSISIYNYAFLMQLNLLPIFQQLRKCRKERIQKSRDMMSIFICAVVVICTLLYWLLGSSSVELYGNKKVQGNILLNLKSDPRMELPVLAVFLTVVLSFPLLFHPLRDLCDDSHTFNNGETSLLTRAKIASLLLLSQLMLAVWIPGVQVVFAFTGASSCLVIGVMFPAIFYTKICPWRKTAHGIALFCSLWTIMIFYSIVSFDAIRFLTFSTFST